MNINKRLDEIELIAQSGLLTSKNTKNKNLFKGILVVYGLLQSAIIGQKKQLKDLKGTLEIIKDLASDYEYNNCDSDIYLFRAILNIYSFILGNL